MLRIVGKPLREDMSDMTLNTEHRTLNTGLTLNACAVYWRVERTGPILSAVAEPTYRQMLDLEQPNCPAPCPALVRGSRPSPERVRCG